MESLRPIDYDALTKANDLLQNFSTYWDQCSKQVTPLEAQQQLFDKILSRVFMYDDQVVALVLHGDFAIILDETKKASLDMNDALIQELHDEGIVTLVSSQSGVDGIRTRDLCLDRAA